jgi:hypothetical protein
MSHNSSTSNSRLFVRKGDDTSIELTFTVNLDTPVNLTGYKLYFTVKKNRTDLDADALITVDWTTHSSPTTGKTVLIIPSSATTNVKAGQYYFDIQWKTPSLAVRTLVSGICEITEQVTIRTN